MAWYNFWIKSNRGTDDSGYIWVPDQPTPKGMKEEVKAQLESWCEQFGAWHHGDNHIRYGSIPVSAPPRKTLLEKIEQEKARQKESVKKLAWF